MIFILSLKDISVGNVSLMYDLSEAFNAMSLRHACILFILEKFDKLIALPWYVTFFLFAPSIFLYSKQIKGLTAAWDIVKVVLNYSISAGS